MYMTLVSFLRPLSSTNHCRHHYLKSRKNNFEKNPASGSSQTILSGKAKFPSIFGYQAVSTLTLSTEPTGRVERSGAHVSRVLHRPPASSTARIMQ
jgi:hypothetical protein